MWAPWETRHDSETRAGQPKGGAHTRHPLQHLHAWGAHTGLPGLLSLSLSGLELSWRRTHFPPPWLPELLIYSCVSFHLANSMGDCQILALTRFNLQAMFCPLSTCLLFKMLRKRFMGRVEPHPVWDEELQPSSCAHLAGPLQSRTGDLAIPSALKQVKSH